MKTVHKLLYTDYKCRIVSFLHLPLTWQLEVLSLLWAHRDPALLSVMDRRRLGVRKHLGSGELADFLREQLKPGEEASVLNTAYPHDGHIDAELFNKGYDGRIYRGEKAHLDPTIYPWSDLKNFNP